MKRIQHKLKLDKYSRWRKQAELVCLSAEGKERLEWMIQIDKGMTIQDIAREYNIGKSVIYKWKKVFFEYFLQSLETRSRKPYNIREGKEYIEKEKRVIKIRQENIMQGKMKLKQIYKDTYGEEISSYYIQKIIDRHNLYHIRKKEVKTRKKGVKRLKITEYGKRVKEYGEIIHLDTIELRHKDMKRYIMTAIDSHTRIAYAYGYEKHSSENAKDFLKRVVYIMGKERIQNIHTDNGSEFAGEFEEYVKELKYTHWYSRVRVSTDNGKCERFNRTVQDEWLRLVGYKKNLKDFNKSLIEYIYYYNTKRPHTSLNYLSPFSFLSNFSTMYSSYTYPCKKANSML
jgi:transposase InsO family protein